MPREFEEHRYFCSLGVRVPTEKAELTFVLHAQNVEARMKRLILLETLRRIGSCCSITQWTGGSGTYGWMAGFEGPSVQWITEKAVSNDSSS